MAKENKVLREIISGLGSQEDVALKLNISQSNLSRYIHGHFEPPTELVMSLCVLSKLEYLPEDLLPKRDWDWLYEFINLYNGNK
jgi:hypothetical protein